MSAAPPTLSVQVISDFACPWCYVGKARLKRAIEVYQQKEPDAKIHVSFSPYMIDPATQAAGEDYDAYCRRRWGGDGWTTSLKRSSRRDGCTFEQWKIWPNTLLAHQLLKFAETKGKAEEVNELIFQTIYERGGNASKLETLVALAVEAGLSAQEARGYLELRQGQDDVVAADKHAKRDIGVQGVPYFIVRKGGKSTNDDLSSKIHGDNGGVVLEGAAAPESLVQALVESSA